MYDALNAGRVEPARLRRALASLPLPRAADGRIVLAVDVSPWLRPDAPTRGDSLFCHVYAPGAQHRAADPGLALLIPSPPWRPAAPRGPRCWTRVRLGPADDATAVTAAQLRGVINRLITAGHGKPGDLRIVIVTDTGYDTTRLA
jgi:hypothetical protein